MLVVLDGGGIPCVIYAAKSTEDVHGSIPGQLQECRRAIEQDPLRRVVGEYSDESHSAYKHDRGPDLERAMRHAEELVARDGVGELWAQHSDRLARGDGKRARHTVEVALWALKHDVRVHTLQDPDTFRDLLYAVVTGQRNFEDSRRKGLAVQAAVRRTAERGGRSAPLPDGYLRVRYIDPDGRVGQRIERDPGRKEVVELIFRLALRGRRTGQIAKTLNSHGWQTRPVRAGPRPFDVQRVYQTLRNPVYAGLAAYKGEVLAKGDWPAYVTPAQHERIVNRMAAGRRHRARPAEPYLLTGLARCGRCGWLLHARSGKPHRDGTVRRRYMCSSRYTHGQSRCSAVPVDALTVEGLLIDSLPALIPDSTSDTAASPRASRVQLAEARGELRDAARGEDVETFDRALERLLALAAPRPLSPALDVRRFRGWIKQEQRGRTGESRAETRPLNRLLHRWFSQITVRVDPSTLTLTATQQAAGVAAVVTVDRVALARDTPAGSARRMVRYGRWDRAEITGALQAWAAGHDRSPTFSDWKPAGPDHPRTVTVLRAFGSWNRALQGAGLEPGRPPRREWNTEEIHRALRRWTRRHGRAPYATEWAHAASDHPTTFVVISRHGHRWNNAVRAAGLEPAPRPRQRRFKPWTETEIRDALRAWTAEHGRPPAGFEWLRAAPGRPQKQTVVKHFGTWQAAVDAATAHGWRSWEGERR